MKKNFFRFKFFKAVENEEAQLDEKTQQGEKLLLVASQSWEYLF